MTIYRMDRSKVEKRISNSCTVYSIESLIKNVNYGVDETDFAMFYKNRAIRCSITEMPALAELVDRYDKDVAQEIRDLHADLRYLVRSHINYTDRRL